ncbi:MAG: radical SAM protein [Nitrospirae bacterium]|nr:radical SAM protein [Nitrospirota bacterium]
MGGSVITYDQEFIHSTLKPDYSLAGEADDTVVMLAEVLEGRGALEAIPNLCYQTDGRLTFTEKNLKFGRDLNEQPFPDYSMFDIEGMLEASMAARPLYRFYRKDPRIMPIVTARECPFACTFCLHGHGGRAKYRARTTENVMEEIKQLYDRYQFNILILLDSLMEYRRRYGWDFNWMFQTHANARLNLESLMLAKEAGCSYFSYGLESASKRVLKSMKKGTQPEQYAEAIAMADQAQIGFGGNFIFGDPAETPETISETLTFYRDHCSDIHCFMSGIQPYPGSALYGVCQDMGLMPDKLVFYQTIDQKVFNMTQMPDAQWIGYLRAIVAFDSLPLCKTVDVTRIIRRALQNRMTVNSGRQFWELFAECPHCNKSFSYIELTEPDRVPTHGLQIITGCEHCCKRIRLNVPVGKDQGLLLPIETDPHDEARPIGQPTGVASSGDELPQFHNASEEVQAFLDRMVTMCEQKSYHAAVAYYDRCRGQFQFHPALVEFDRLVGTLRHKLAA